MGFIAADFSGIILLVSLFAVSIAFFVSAGMNSSSSKKCVQHLDIFAGLGALGVFIVLAFLGLIFMMFSGAIVVWLGAIALIAAAGMAIWSAIDNAKHTQCNQYIDIIIAVYSILVVVVAVLLAYVL